MQQEQQHEQQQQQLLLVIVLLLILVILQLRHQHLDQLHHRRRGALQLLHECQQVAGLALLPEPGHGHRHRGGGGQQSAPGGQSAAQQPLAAERYRLHHCRQVAMQRSGARFTAVGLLQQLLPRPGAQHQNRVGESNSIAESVHYPFQAEQLQR